VPEVSLRSERLNSRDPHDELLHYLEDITP
jgi:hypothetical protein